MCACHLPQKLPPSLQPKKAAIASFVCKEKLLFCLQGLVFIVLSELIRTIILNPENDLSTYKRIVWCICFMPVYPIYFLGTSEESVTEVTRELSSLGFEVWDTCLGDHGVTLAFT